MQKAILVCLTTLLLPMATISAEPTIRFVASVESKPAETVRVSGIVVEDVAKTLASVDGERDWSTIFRVHTVSDGKLNRTPLLGEYEAGQDYVEFRPRYPFQAGVTYRAVFDQPGRGEPKLEADYTPPRKMRTAPTKLVAIFPSTDVVPENLLKFYLHFSGPMSRGEAYQRIRLFKEDGEQIEVPFLELAEELWSPDGRRFTLYFDPGRIKRGLKPREEIGPALAEGGKYTLVIDANWPDADGEPLAEKVTKSLRVVEPDDVQPDPTKWKLRAPQAESFGELVIDFEEPLDSALLERVLVVRAPNGDEVMGDVQISQNERRWRFKPLNPWQPGTYELVVATTLEDLAGNSIGRPFEVDVFRRAPVPSEADYYRVKFEIKGLPKP